MKTLIATCAALFLGTVSCATSPGRLDPSRAPASSKQQKDAARPEAFYNFLNRQTWTKKSKVNNSLVVTTPRLSCGSGGMVSSNCYVIDGNGYPAQMANDEEYESLGALRSIISDRELGGFAFVSNSWMNINSITCEATPIQGNTTYACKIDMAFPLSGADPRKKKFCDQQTNKDPDCAY